MDYPVWFALPGFPYEGAQLTRKEDIERRKNMKAVNEGERGEFREQRRKEAIQEIKDERAMIKAHAEMGIPYPHDK